MKFEREDPAPPCTEAGVPADPDRRRLLQLGAAGVTAVIGSGGASLLAGSGQGAPAAPQPPVPPEATGVIDPAGVPFETWAEPWVWRPADWPDQALDLNVVERNE